MHPRTLILFFGGEEVGSCSDFSLELSYREPIEVTQIGDSFRQFAPSPPSWLIKATDIQWKGNPNDYFTSSIALIARMIQDEAIVEGEVFIEEIEDGTDGVGIIHHSATFRGQGAIVSFGDRQIDRTPLDSIGGLRPILLLERGDRVAPSGGFKIDKIFIDDNFTSTTPVVRPEKRSKATNRKDSDKTPRGFRIVP